MSRAGFAVRVTFTTALTVSPSRRPSHPGWAANTVSSAAAAFPSAAWTARGTTTPRDASCSPGAGEPVYSRGIPVTVALTRTAEPGGCSVRKSRDGAVAASAVVMAAAALSATTPARTARLGRRDLIRARDSLDDGRGHPWEEEPPCTSDACVQDRARLGCPAGGRLRCAEAGAFPRGPRFTRRMRDRSRRAGAHHARPKTSTQPRAPTAPTVHPASSVSDPHTHAVMATGTRRRSHRTLTP